MKLKLLKTLYQLLEGVPGLVDLYEAKRADFLSSVRAWIREGEAVLTEFGCPQAADLAGLRSFITAAEEGVFESSFNIPDRTPRYRARAAVGVQVLDRATKVLQNLLSPEAKRIEEARHVLKQAMVMNGPQESTPGKRSKKKRERPDPEEIWHRLWSREDTRTLMRHLLTFVCYDDARELTTQMTEGWFVPANQDVETHRPHRK